MPKLSAPNRCIDIANHKWWYTFKKGTSPGKMSRTFGVQHGHTVFVSLERNRNRFFSSFESVDAFRSYYFKFPEDERCFYWVNTSSVDANITCILHFDLEWYLPEQESTPLARISKLTEIVNQALGIYVDPIVEDWSRMCGPGRYKHSYHVYFPTVVFDNNGKDCMGAFVDDEIIKRACGADWLYFDSGINSSLIVDTSIYSNGKQFRVYGSHKEGMTLRARPSVELFMATAIGGCTRAVTTEPVRPTSAISDEDESMDESLPCDVDHGPIHDSYTHNTTIKLQRMLTNRGDNHTQVVFTNGVYCGITDQIHGRQCFVSNHIAHSNNCFFRVKPDGSVYYHCHSVGHHDKSKGINIGSIDNVDAVSWDGDRWNGRCERLSEWPETTLVSEFDGEYVETLQCYPGLRAMLVAAGMGQGKTSRAHDLIESFGRDKRVLVIVPRQTLTRSLHQRFNGFTHYSESRFASSDRIIIEYESLHRLIKEGDMMEHVELFDLVIVDEIRTVCNSMTIVDTNGPNLHTNSTLFRALAVGSSMFVGLDADAEVDPVVSWLYSSWWPHPGQVRVLRYTTPKITRSLELSTNETGWLSKLSTRLADCRRVNPIGIACRTKSRAKIFEDMFKRKGYSVLCITADTSDEDVRYIFDDVNTAVDGVDVLIFTSKVCVGVDITCEFDMCFVDTIGRGACARNMTQMIGRFRHLTSSSVPVLAKTINPIYRSRVELEFRASEYFRSRADVTGRIYRYQLRRVEEFVDGYIRMSPDWVTRLFALCKTEDFADFLMEFYRLSTLKGWTITVEDDGEEPDMWMVSIGTVCKSLRESRESDVFDCVSNGNICQIIIETSRKIKLQISSLKDKMLLECANVVRYFESSPLVDVEQFKLASKFMRQLRNCHRVKKLNTEQLLRMAVRSLPTDWTNISAHAFCVQKECVDAIFERLGIDGPFDCDSVFTNKDLTPDVVSFIHRQCDISIGASHRSIDTSRRKPLSRLRTELKYIYGTTIKSCRSVRGGPSDTHRIHIPEKLAQLIDKVDFNYDGNRHVDLTSTGVRMLPSNRTRKRKLMFN